MIRAYTMRYLADIKGLPYYQRRYPKALDGHPALTSKMFKCRIHASLDDASAVAMEIQRISNAFDDYVHTLTASNSAMLNDLEIERMAQSYLEVNRLKVGELATSHSAYNSLRADELSDLDVFKDMKGHYFSDFDSGVESEQSDLVKVQQAAWRLLKTPLKAAPSVKLFSDAFSDLWIYKGMSQEVKTHRRDRSLWERFLRVNGGDTLVTNETLREYLQGFVNHLYESGVKTSSVERYLTAVLEPINAYNLTLTNKLTVERPKLKRRPQPNRKPPLELQEQVDLVNQLQYEAEWKELYVLLALHSGLHPNEARQLTEENFTFEGEIPTVHISNKKTERKNQYRERVVPLFYRVGRIQELIELGALSAINKKTSDNIGLQIKQLLGEINPEASVYSLRHTLRHNADSHCISVIIQSELGGWAATSMGVSEHMAGYGQSSKNSPERLRARLLALKTILDHLPR